MFGPSEGEQWNKDVFFLKYERYVFFYIVLLHNSSFFSPNLLRHLHSLWIILFIQTVSPFLNGSNPVQFFITSWHQPNLEVASNILTIWCYICLEMRLIIGILGRLANSEQKKLLQKTKKELNFWLKLNGRNTGISTHLLILFWGLSASNDIFLYLETLSEIGQSFEKKKKTIRR